MDEAAIPLLTDLLPHLRAISMSAFNRQHFINRIEAVLAAYPNNRG